MGGPDTGRARIKAPRWKQAPCMVFLPGGVCRGPGGPFWTEAAVSRYTGPVSRQAYGALTVRRGIFSAGWMYGFPRSFCPCRCC